MKVSPMRRPALYSSSRPAPAQQATAAAQPAPEAAPLSSPRRSRWRLSASSPALLWAAIALLAALLAGSLAMRPANRKLTQEDINAAVLKTLETQQLPSEYAKAYENIRPSVVRVVSYVHKSRIRDKDDKDGKSPLHGKPRSLVPRPGIPRWTTTMSRPASAPAW